MDNKRVAIQTCFIDNYGACLQAYAIQKEVNKALGYEGSLILPFDRYVWFRAFDSNKDKLKTFLKKIKYFRNKSFKNNAKIHRNFEKFRNKFLIFDNRKLTRNYKYFYELNNTFDSFVCGSDVIWNPTFRKENLWYDMLRFAEDDKKIVAYAPSFGISRFPEELCDEAKEHLSRFTSLSCREDEGVKIIKDQFGLSAEHVLDPTLLLSKDEWSLLTKKSKVKAKKDYMVIYMFDDMPLEKIVNKILEETNYDIYLFPFGNVKNYIFKNKRIHNACRVSGPIEFVYLIGHAKLILANSLHALAFSINMNTPFVIFNRDELDEEHSINSRMRSMTRMFKFENRIVKFSNFFDSQISDYTQMNFDESNSILLKQREFSKMYLKDSINE